jgi:hypothetical protein
MPPSCVCCNEKATTKVSVSASKRYSKNKSVSKSWEFPCCEECKNHIDYYNISKYSFWGAIFVGGFLCLIFPPIGIAVVVFLSLTFFISRSKAKKGLKYNCSSLVPAVKYNGWYGTEHSFTFTNKDYAELFSAFNHQKVSSSLNETTALRDFKKSNMNNLNERNMLLIAQKKNGVLTASELSLELNIPIESIKLFLNKYCEQNVCEKILTDKGIEEYHFNELKI